MRGSHRKNVPPLFAQWLAQANRNWQPQYSAIQSPEKEAVVAALWEAQRGLCVYCGRELSRDTSKIFYHIEHFRPQSTYPTLETCFANLFLSCNQGNTCGVAKANWFDEHKHIEPDYPGCTDRFRFVLTEDIVPATAGDNAAQEMINRLNLNYRELRVTRGRILELIDAGELDISAAN